MPVRISIFVRRLGFLLSSGAAVVGVVAFLEQWYPDLNLVASLVEGIEQLGEWWGLLPSAGIGSLRIGHFILVMLGLALFFIFFYEPKEALVEVGETTLDVEKAQLRELKALRKALREQATAWSEPVRRFREADYVNAPLGVVWEALSEAPCGPACQELLDQVEVTGRREDMVLWEGKARVAAEEIPVAGATRLSPPGGLEVRCTGGALKGFRASYALLEEEDRTQVEETAEFDAHQVPPEFLRLVPQIAALVDHAVDRDLERLRERLEGLSP